MQNYKKNSISKYNILPFLLGIIVFVSFFVSLFASTFYPEENMRKTHLLFLFLAVTFFVVMEFILSRQKKYDIIKQLWWIGFWSALILVAVMFRGAQNIMDYGGWKYRMSFVLLLMAALFSVLFPFMMRTYAISVKKVKDLFFTHKFLIVLLTCISIIAICQMDVIERWDGNLLQNDYRLKTLCQIFNLKDMTLCNHVSYFFTAVIVLLSTITGDLYIAIPFANIIVLIIGVFYFYRIVRLVSVKSDLLCAVVTAVYAFSPFILGLASYTIYDYYLYVLFPAVVYTAYSHKWIYHFIFAVFFCFSKEPAVIAYVGFCLGVVIGDLVKSRSLKVLFSSKQYYLMALVGLSWFLCYKFVGSWSANGSFGQSGSGSNFEEEVYYIASILKICLVLNFSWILLLVVFIGLVLCIKKKDRVLWFLIPVLTSSVFTIIFNCAFKTVILPRYIDSHIACLNIAFAIILVNILKERHTQCVAWIISVLMLISNYRAIDPLSLMTFARYDIGDTYILGVDEYNFFNDKCVYNQQYRGLSSVINLAMKDVINTDDVFAFPVAQNNHWYFEGIHFTYDCNHIEAGFYDANRERMVAYGKDGDLVINVLNLTDDYDLTKLLENYDIYFFTLPGFGENLLEQYRNQGIVVEEMLFRDKGWTLTRAKLHLGYAEDCEE